MKEKQAPSRIDVEGISFHYACREEFLTMSITGKEKNLSIAYIGGGSRGWAWGLMSDLAACDDISGDVYLYDINYEAAQHNEIIGNSIFLFD